MQVGAASECLRCLSSTAARLYMLVSVLGCFLPSVVLVNSSVYRLISLASAYLPWLSSIIAKRNIYSLV